MITTIENKVAVVTGGASGIGFSIVDNFIKHGAKLAIIIDISEELGNQAIDIINKRYGGNKAVFFKCDVTSELEECFEKISTEYKNIELLVNNAGIGDEHSIRRTININVISVMEWSKKFYDYMRKDKNGHGGTIINMASVYGLKVTPFMPYYHSSKFAVIGFTKSLGHEYNFKRTGVRVVAVCPGFTYTQLTKSLYLPEENIMEDFMEEVKSSEWQEVEPVGQGVKEVYENADSGTAWIIKGSRPPVLA